MTTASVAFLKSTVDNATSIWRKTDTGSRSHRRLLRGIKPLLQLHVSLCRNMMAYSLLTDQSPEGSQFFKWRAVPCTIDCKSASP
jgi:hypothetical protein